VYCGCVFACVIIIIVDYKQQQVLQQPFGWENEIALFDMFDWFIRSRLSMRMDTSAYGDEDGDTRFIQVLCFNPYLTVF